MPALGFIDTETWSAVQGDQLPYLAGWAAQLVAIGLRLPEQQLAAICSYVGRHMEQLKRGDRKNLLNAFESWGHQPGLALLSRDLAQSC